MFQRLVKAIRRDHGTARSAASAVEISPVYTPREMAACLRALAGRRIHIDYQQGVDGPQTAARLVGETFGRFGVELVSAPEDAEVCIWVFAVTNDRFGWSVRGREGQGIRIEAQCGPRELTASIMTGVCEVFRRLDP